MTPSGTTRLAEATPTVQRAVRRSCDLSGIADSQSRIAESTAQRMEASARPTYRVPPQGGRTQT
jgi:hypothetical protein